MQNNRNFAWPVTDTYPDNVFALQNCLDKNEDLFRQRGITLFGAGIHGCEFLKLLERKGYPVRAFVDNNPDKQGGWVNEYPILSLGQALQSQDPLAILVAVENFAIIRDQLLAVGLVEGRDFFCVETSVYKKYLESFRRPGSGHLLVLGDCCLSAISLLDDNYTNLAEMLQQRLGNAAAKVLAMHGMGMGAYYHVLRRQWALGMRPARVLLEVNLETFMSRHHLLPRSQHVPLLEMLYAEPGCADQEFREFIDLAARRFGAFQSDFFSGAAKSQENRVSENSAKLFLKMNYMYALDCAVEGFVYYMKILEFFRDEGVPATLFVPPVNYHFAEKLFGGAFRLAYDANLDKLREKTCGAGFSLLELNYALQPEEFCAVDTPTETCNYAGRVKLCEVLARGIEGSGVSG